MKRLLLILALACSPALFTGCSSAPDQRIATYNTLKAVGETADGAVATAAHLYAIGAISADQARSVNTLYDTKFSPSFRLAVAAAQSDLSASAPADLIALSTQLASLLLSFQAIPSK